LSQCADIYGTLFAKKSDDHVSLCVKSKGFLLLGKSETTGGVPDLFASIEKTINYIAKDVPNRFVQMASHRTESNLVDNKTKSKPKLCVLIFKKQLMLSKYSPAGVVINEAMDIVQFRGSTSRFRAIIR
jgi:two-component system CheB/CheR fusion protein